MDGGMEKTKRTCIACVKTKSKKDTYVCDSVYVNITRELYNFASFASTLLRKRIYMLCRECNAPITFQWLCC